MVGTSVPLALIPLLPFAGFLFNGVFGRKVSKSVSGLVACLAIGGAFVVAALNVWSLVQQVKFQIDRFRVLTLAMADRPLTIVNEHAAIIDAIATRDPDAAATAMCRHLDTVRSGLDAARALNPDYFADDTASTIKTTRD